MVSFWRAAGGPTTFCRRLDVRDQGLTTAADLGIFIFEDMKKYYK